MERVTEKRRLIRICSAAALLASAGLSGVVGADVSAAASGDPNLPALIDGVEPESHSYVPVVQDSNGNLYRITESYLAERNQPKVMKSADQGQTWAEMDAAHRPGTDTNGIGDLESGWVTYDPGDHLLTFTWQRSYVVYSSYRTSDHPTNPDTWVSNTRENIAGVTGSPQYASHTHPTDQPYEWVFFSNGTTNPQYRSRSGPGTYGPITPVDSSGRHPAAILDSADVTHILYRKATNQLHYKTLTSAGALQGTSTRVDTSSLHTVPIAYAAPQAYIDGASTYVGALFLNGSGHLKFVLIRDGNPGSEETITTSAVTTNPDVTTNDGAVVSLALHGTTFHAVWSDATTGDVMHSQRPSGGAWSTPENLVTLGGTAIAEWVYASVVTHNGNDYLAFTYDEGPHGEDDSNIFYDRFPLGGSGTPSTNAAPVVSAGPDQTVTLPATATLDGTVSDDGLPANSTLSSTWSGMSGPGPVTFADPTATDTTATFSAAGSHVLQLSATDGQLTSSDTVTVTVNPDAGGGGTITTVEARIAAGSDDAEQSPSGSVNLSSSDLELVADGNTIQVVGLRFRTLDVPKDATIVNAYIQFQTDEAKSGAASLSVAAQDADSATTFARTSSNISARPRTASVAWAPSAWSTVGERGSAQRTPDLSAALQQVVSRPGWATGNAVAFIITGTGTRTAVAYDRSAAAAPELHVQYRTG